ncbi:MAG: indole-3-glycerol phosphate synthase TrpC [Flavobacteriales bacterium]|nr:indole-3-glycerol phosphate synthase TrpC [Flavobacteriales bacterium]MCB9449055.1 indole-3-glycerol phosphate synthase TrpC [Flavobacteriales bacterium]
MNILEKIIASKFKEVEERKSLFPVKLLEGTSHFTAPVVSMETYIRRPDLSGIIAEIKRKSPSKGVINAHISVEQVSLAYMAAGASALSVLTDKEYFGGSSADLTTARKFNYCPILRKDFTVDEYQIIEARSIGADAILLIAAALSPKRVKELASFARSLGLEVLLELHDESELGHITDEVNIVGINNRNLKTFDVSVQTSLDLLPHLPKEKTLISESGLSDPAAVMQLKDAGFNGFLIGETFMKTGRPGAACSEFIKSLKSSAYAKATADKQV